MEQIAAKLSSLWGNGAKWVRDADPGAHEAAYLKLDSSKAHAELQWNSKLTIQSALEWTAAWYRSVGLGADMQGFSFEQIAAYERL